jgi:peptidoglycan-N-acetylglucosamine deacetylase
MTFDDGPHPVLTPRLLDMLKARGIKATFFLIGQNAEYPDIVRRIAAEGHEIGNHTWNHPQLTKLSPAALREEIDRTSSTSQRLSESRSLSCDRLTAQPVTTSTIG